MTNKEVRKLETLANRRNYSIAMSNTVIDKMRNGLSAQQHDVLDFLFMQIKADDTQETRYTVSVEDYCRMSNITYKTNSVNYKDVEAALKELNNQCKWIKVSEHETALIYWLSNVVIDENKDTINYNIDASVAPYLFNLVKTGHYTQYSFRDTRALNSKYAKTLYVILKRYIDCKIFNPLLPIDRLKAQLNAEHYTLTKDFRVRVIEQAMEEINAKTYMRVKIGNKGKFHKAAGSRAATHVPFELEYVGLEDEEYEMRQWNNAKEFGERDLFPPI